MGIKDVLDFKTIEELWNYQLDGTGITVAEMREEGFATLSDSPKLIPRDELKFPTPSGKIEIESEILRKAGLQSVPPYVEREAPQGDRFYLLFGRTATLAHGQSLNNPILNEISAEQVLWIHPDRAGKLGISDGDEVEVNGGGTYTAGCGPM